MDDDAPRDKSTEIITPGQDISSLSIDELEERIAVYEAEIARLKVAIESKNASLSAANSVFKM